MSNQIESSIFAFCEYFEQEVAVKNLPKIRNLTETAEAKIKGWSRKTQTAAAFEVFTLLLQMLPV